MRDLSKAADALERSMLQRLSPENALRAEVEDPEVLSSCDCVDGYACDGSCANDYYPSDDLLFEDEEFEQYLETADDRFEDESVLARQEEQLFSTEDFSWWIPFGVLEKWDDGRTNVAIIEPDLLENDLSQPSPSRRILLRRQGGRIMLDLYRLDDEEIPPSSLTMSLKRLASNPYLTNGELEVSFTTTYGDHSFIGELFGYNLSDPQRVAPPLLDPTAQTERQRMAAKLLRSMREVPWTKCIKDCDCVWVNRQALTTWGTGFRLNYHFSYVTEAHPDFPVRLFRHDEDSPWMFDPRSDRKLRKWLNHKQSEVDPTDQSMTSIEAVR